MTAKLSWAMVDGVFRSVKDFAHLKPADRPLALCPQCDELVTMKLGDVVAHHAAHRLGSECPMNWSESVLHLEAKMHLSRKLRAMSELLVKEDCKSRFSALGCVPSKVSDWAAGWDEVAVEQRVGTRRPDVLLLRAGEPCAAIEVLATHAVDVEKSAELRSLGLPWLEVRAEEIVRPSIRWKWDGGPLRFEKCGPERQKYVCYECSAVSAKRQWWDSEKARYRALARKWRRAKLAEAPIILHGMEVFEIVVERETGP